MIFPGKVNFFQNYDSSFLNSMNELKVAIVAFLLIEFKIQVNYRICSLIFSISF